MIAKSNFFVIFCLISFSCIFSQEFVQKIEDDCLASRIILRLQKDMEGINTLLKKDSDFEKLVRKNMDLEKSAKKIIKESMGIYTDELKKSLLFIYSQKVRNKILFIEDIEKSRDGYLKLFFEESVGSDKYALYKKQLMDSQLRIDEKLEDLISVIPEEERKISTFHDIQVVFTCRFKIYRYWFFGSVYNDSNVKFEKNISLSIQSPYDIHCIIECKEYPNITLELKGKLLFYKIEDGKFDVSNFSLENIEMIFTGKNNVIYPKITNDVTNIQNNVLLGKIGDEISAVIVELNITNLGKNR